MTELSTLFTNKKGSFEFPLILIKDPSDALAVFLNSADKGDIPIVINDNGKINSIYRIGLTIRNIKRLIVPFSIRIYLSKDNSVDIKHISDIPEEMLNQIEPFLCEKQIHNNKVK